MELVRRHLWMSSGGFSMFRRDSDSEKVPAALYDRLTDTPTYAARMYKVQLRGCVQTCPGIAYFPVRHSSSGRNPASSTHQPGGDIWAPAFAGAANTPPHGPLVFLTQTLSSTLYVRAALVPGRCKYSCRIFTTSFLAGDIQKMLTETLGMRLPCTLITHDYANFG